MRMPRTKRAVVLLIVSGFIPLAWVPSAVATTQSVPANSAALARYMPPKSKAMTTTTAFEVNHVQPTARLSASSVRHASAAEIAKAATDVHVDPSPRQLNPDAALNLPQRPATAIPLPTPGNVQPAISSSGQFAGIDNSNAPTAPADPSTAVGPSDSVQTVNTSLAAWTRSGGFTKEFQDTLADLFQQPAGSLFDPHTIYENATSRFIVIADDGVNWHVLVTSGSSFFLSTWCIYTIKANTALEPFADFPLEAADGSYLYLTMMLFNAAKTKIVGNHYMRIPLSQLDACGTLVTTGGLNLKNPGTTSFAAPLVPDMNYDTGDPNGYFVSSYLGGGSHVSTWVWPWSSSKITGHQVSVPSYGQPAPAPQEGTTALIDTGDARFFQAESDRFHVYTASTSSFTANGVKTTDVSWYKLDAFSGNLVESGGFYFTGAWVYYPSMGQDANGDALFTFSLSGTNNYPSSVVMPFYLATNNYGTAAFLNVGQSYYNGIASTNCTNCYRWGDFSSTYPDIAVNPNQFIVTNETVENTITWGTEIAYVSP